MSRRRFSEKPSRVQDPTDGIRKLDQPVLHDKNGDEYLRPAALTVEAELPKQELARWTNAQKNLDRRNLRRLGSNRETKCYACARSPLEAKMC